VPTANQARASIYNRFNTLWGPLVPYTLDNEKFTPPETGAWVRLSVRNIDAGQETLGPVGTRKYERKGLINVQVFTETNKGVFEADSLSKLAQDIFEGVRFDEVIANNSIIKEVGVSDGWYQNLVQIDFFYTEIK
jgi:hypothetical protein